MTKILIIEDERPYRENILDLLEAEEFEALGAENGAIGVQLAQEEAPDLILCDIMMPELDGYGVLAALRQNPQTAAIPFIFLTAKADKSDFRAGMALGADDYVTKPFTRNEIMSAILTRLERQKSITQPYSLALEKATERLNHLLHYDSATNLPNRLLLRDRFNQLVADKLQKQQNAEEGESCSIPILLLGLDRFQRVTDSLSTGSIDRLIQDVVARIGANLSTQDTMARLNTDRFAILLANLTNKEVIASLVQGILSSFTDPFMAENRSIFLTASIGIAFYPNDGQDVNGLTKNALAALGLVQKHGGNHYQFYSAEMDSKASTALILESSLRKALEREEFQIHYQPIVDLASNKIIGSEALVRWQHPELGAVSPAQFIPIAEETGLIIPLGEWVLETACNQAKKWIEGGFESFHLSVNISARQFLDSHLIERISTILERTGFNTKNLELELTETALVENAQSALAALNKLKQLGLSIAIDDFGTGYATLSYLKQFPFDTLKVDRFFVRDINSDTYNKAIVTAVIQMAHNLNLKVTAEGVETETERAFLSQQQCNTVQGYLFSRPLPAPDFEKLLGLSGNC